MSTKHQFRARVRNVNYDYLENYQIVNDHSNVGEALDSILEEHKELSTNNWSLQYISQTVAHTVNERISTELNRIRLGTNNTDRNTQILIELLQGYMQLKNVEHIPTTDVYKPEFLTYTENVIKEQITHQKQRKHSKQK